ncbi:YceI family protein [Gillisia limnaea]|uniref:YceI family protein n=1 Tax=Gillisia limnaea TaxID=195907 RepID=UPI0002D42424|nr:YceI family protein [Gillisia limnaea]
MIFFNASKYPKINFESTGFEQKSGKNYVVNGNLTIKDIAKIVSVPFEYKGEMNHPMMEGTKILGAAIQYRNKPNRF